MKIRSSSLTVLLVTAVLFSRCSVFSPSARRERAYAAYVRKCSLGRVKQQKRFRPTITKLPVMEPSEPVESSGPVSVTSSGS